MKKHAAFDLNSLWNSYILYAADINLCAYYSQIPTSLVVGTISFACLSAHKWTSSIYWCKQLVVYVLEWTMEWESGII